MIDFVKVHFLGGANTVTGSKFLLEVFEKKILVDCGVFQGLKELREENWKAFSVNPKEIDFVLLTHGHLDHVGYLPRLYKQGFRGRILGTAPTLAITEIILKDSAKIHEEEAKKAAEEKYSKHAVVLPFYTEEDVDSTLKLFEFIEEGERVELFKNITCRFLYNGHIIGATFIELDVNEKRFVFSGDIGRENDYLLEAPKKPMWADYLFLESTYGYKLHPKENIETVLSQIVKEVIQEKGDLIIPSFAVERLQTLMYILWKLYKENKIPNIPIYVDSPMGNNVLSVFKQFSKWHKLTKSECDAMCSHINIVQSFKETWEVIDKPKSKIIIAGSGMVTGGRILTYLKQMIDDPLTTILLVGYQAEGTRGRQLQEGCHEIKFFGKYFPVRAKVKTIESLSAHADQVEIISWIDDIKNIPEEVFLIHGEPTALNTLRVKLKEVKKWMVTIPKLNDVVELMV